MNFEEHVAKPLLAAAGISVPKSRLVTTAEEAAGAAEELGPCVIKAQVPTGKRGKAGGIKLAATPDEARSHTNAIIGMEIDGHVVEKVLVEEQVAIAKELYISIINNSITKNPYVTISTQGGMDVEEVCGDVFRWMPLQIDVGIDGDAAHFLWGSFFEEQWEPAALDRLGETTARLYQVYDENDAELVEINPLVVTEGGDVVALDCKFVLDDSAIKRQPELAAKGSPEKLTGLEATGEELGIKYIELDGDVGVLANGAGLTMTTMDVVRHHGGRPANFCEIGGEAYTKGKAALDLVLSKPGIKSLVVNFCGAFARCDVMMEGLLNAWTDLKPDIPVFFSIAGTGDEEAIAMLKAKLGLDPYPDMDAASKAAVEAAAEAGGGS